MMNLALFLATSGGLVMIGCAFNLVTDEPAAPISRKNIKTMRISFTVCVIGCILAIVDIMTRQG